MDIHEVRGIFNLLVDVLTSHGVLRKLMLVYCGSSLIQHFNVFCFTVITIGVQIFSNWWFQSIGILS